MVHASSLSLSLPPYAKPRFLIYVKEKCPSGSHCTEYKTFFLLFWCHQDENMGFPRRHGSKEKIGHGYDPLLNPRRNRVSELKRGLVLNPISSQYQSATLAVSKNKNNNNNILETVKLCFQIRPWLVHFGLKTMLIVNRKKIPHSFLSVMADSVNIHQKENLHIHTIEMLSMKCNTLDKTVSTLTLLVVIRSTSDFTSMRREECH